MKKYEIMFIVVPTLGEDEVGKLLKTLKMLLQLMVVY